jgi:hypothetical protein
VSESGAVQLEYGRQLARGRAIIADTPEALTLTLPPTGTWPQVKGMWPGLPFVLLPYAPLFYFKWHFASTFGVTIPVPWLTIFFQVCFVALFLLCVAWLVGGIGAEIVISRSGLRVRKWGRLRETIREWPAEQVGRVKSTRFSGVWILGKRGHELTRFGIRARADREWVASLIRQQLDAITSQEATHSQHENAADPATLPAEPRN